MATMNQVQQPAQIGSGTWVVDERKRVNDLLEERVEDFYCTFAEKPMEWLNAHMEGIFSGTNIDVAEVFKTPGKLRGRTPRTTKTLRRAQPREPLGDIFTSNVRSPAHGTQFYQRVAQIHVAENKENSQVPRSHRESPLKEAEKAENDNILPKDKAQIHYISKDALTPQQIAKSIRLNQGKDLAQSQITAPYFDDSIDTVHRITDDSYVTAHEVRIVKPEEAQNETETAAGAAGYSKSDDVRRKTSPSTLMALSKNVPNVDEVQVMSRDASRSLAATVVDKTLTRREEKNISEESTPERPSLRESSLPFACLPAREPLTNFKGAEYIASRTSQPELSKDASTMQSGANSADTSYEPTLIPDEPVNKAQSTQQDAKTSTQRLQERLALLGKPSMSRPSKSIPNGAVPMQAIAIDAVPKPTAQSLWSDKAIQPAPSVEDNDEDWIGPIHNHEPTRIEKQHNNDSKPQQASGYPTVNAKIDERLFVKSAQRPESIPRVETNQLPLLMMQHAQISAPITYPDLQQYDAQSTTPAGSPASRKPTDGPLSTSKAKFYSVLQSAKGIFASSAGASAMAKMGMLPQAASATTMPNQSENDHEHLSVIRGPPQNQPLDAVSILTAPKAAPLHSKSQTVDEESLPRRSSGRIASLKAKSEIQESFVDNGPKVFEHQFKADLVSKDRLVEVSMKDESSQNYPQKSHEPRRPIKIGKDVASKAKPAPVSIKVASQRIGQALPSNTVLAASLQDSLPPSLANKTATVAKKASNTSLHKTLSSQNLKASAAPTTARPKALEAAARKREMDEREAQRKAEQKREIERRRAAKQEGERRHVQEQKMVDQKALDSKNVSQKPATEPRKLEALHKHDEQRANALTSQNMLSDDRQVFPARPTRPGSNAVKSLTRPPIPHINPAKPPKRVNATEGDDERTAVAPEAHPAKRRRTSENSHVEPPARPTMAPPIRLSAMRKEAASKPAQSHTKQSFYGGNTFNRSTNLAPHHSQHPKTPHANDMSKSLNSRSAFVDVPNPPGNTLHYHGQQSNKPQGTKSVVSSAIKSSPQYPNGESIELPEIQTESEDSDDDRGDFIPPAWADSPALRDLLRRQQLVDPREVFGPIAPLMMEEVFKGSKGTARFRPRSSSANWNGPDRLTEEERKRDYEAREQIEREQGWTYRAGV